MCARAAATLPQDWNRAGRPDASGAMVGGSVALRLEEVHTLLPDITQHWLTVRQDGPIGLRPRLPIYYHICRAPTGPIGGYGYSGTPRCIYIYRACSRYGVQGISYMVLCVWAGGWLTVGM